MTDDEIMADPVTCEGCAVRLPASAAFTTSDPAYLCARCAVPFVLSEHPLFSEPDIDASVAKQDARRGAKGA